MDTDRYFVLTGGPGAGKTTVLEALKARGFATTDEAGRAVIRDEIQNGRDGLPWADRDRFGALMFEWERDSYRRAADEAGPVLFDRGLPDTIGYLRLEGLDVPDRMADVASRLRYNRRVFIAPPWKAIYAGDAERRQSWDVAVRTFEMMQQTYTEFGYELVELPLVSVGQRVEFMIAAMSPDQPRAT